MGTEQEFELDEEYNYEFNISMNIELNKTCYSKGETIQGFISLFSKNILKKTILINPYAKIILLEKHHYEYSSEGIIKNKKIDKLFNQEKKEEENITLLSKTLVFQKYNNSTVSSEALKIPFQIRIPKKAYPSCIFDSTSYVKHFLIIEFPFINAKKTIIIIIKNNIYFSDDNNLLKCPLIITNEISKCQLLFLNSGSFKYSITLPKNIFYYEEVIPFLIDIETYNLSFSIKGINISLYRIIKYNLKKDKKNIFKENQELIRKYIILKKGESHLYIEDKIQLPISPEEFNPKVVYSILDNERKNYKNKDKFKDIKLFPACYGGLLSCQYFIKFIFDMESFFTTNEEIDIELDLYEKFIDFNDNTNEMKNNETDNNIKVSDELPDESEINEQIKTTEEYNKFVNQYNKDDEAPPPNNF